MLIKINKYTPCPRIIRLGTSGSYGIETLEFEFNEDWDGLTKKINFFPDDAVEGVTVILGDALSCPVPAEMTARAGVGKIVAEGYDNDRRILSVTIRAMIEGSAGSADKEPVKPTPSEAEQALLIAKKAKEIAENGVSDEKIQQAVTEYLKENPSSSLPIVGAEDEGKVMTVVGGEWKAAPVTIPYNEVTNTAGGTTVNIG